MLDYLVNKVIVRYMLKVLTLTFVYCCVVVCCCGYYGYHQTVELKKPVVWLSHPLSVDSNWLLVQVAALSWGYGVFQLTSHSHVPPVDNNKPKSLISLCVLTLFCIAVVIFQQFQSFYVTDVVWSNSCVRLADPKRVHVLRKDASEFSLGGVLLQKHGGIKKMVLMAQNDNCYAKLCRSELLWPRGELHKPLSVNNIDCLEVKAKSIIVTSFQGGDTFAFEIRV